MTKFWSNSFFASASFFGQTPLSPSSWSDVTSKHGHLISSSNICERIEQLIPGSISLPSAELYTTSLSSYYSAQEDELEPLCIFQPSHVAEVSQFIKLVTIAAPPVQFAVRSGGHAVFAGAANIQDGITVDLRKLNGVELSEDKTIAAVSTGAIWSELYPQLVPHNLTVMGGRVAGVGVGGFVTGGGISHLSRRHGWACDSVVGYQVVLGSGEIVYATADSHRDLWLALRGGSNNLGIVTRFDLQTYPLKGMYGGSLLFEYSDAQLDAQAAAFSEYMSAEEFDDAADMFVGLFYLNPGGTKLVGNVLYYAEPVDKPKVYRSFTSLPSPIHNTLRVTNVSDLSTEQASTLSPTAKRSINMVYSFRNTNAAIYRQLFQAWEDGLKPLADIEGLQLIILFQPHPVSEGLNSLGLPPGGHDLVMVVVTVAYSRKEDDDAVRTGLGAMISSHEDILQRQGDGIYVDWKYLNYADYLQDPIGKLPRETRARLRFASMKYDPDGVFQRLVPGGFKLFS